MPSIKELRALERKNELASTEPDLGRYLYESGRCAVAHAYTEPIADPEDVADRTRLAKDLPLIQALAEHVIETKLGVKSQGAVWREHVYQLDGFRSLIGAETVGKLKSKQYEGLPALTLPPLSLRVRDQAQLPSFQRLIPAKAAIADGILWLVCRADSGALEAVIGLDLPNELLLFDPERGVGIRQAADRTSITAQVDALQLIKHLLCNGSLEVHAAESGMLLGRTDPYIGQNIDLSGSLTNLDRSIGRLQAQLREACGGPESSNTRRLSGPPEPAD